MKTKKEILFLGAYIDSINAQDINCYNIAKYIDKDKYEIHALTYGDDLDIKNVYCHRVKKNRLLKNICKLYYLISVRADVYYLPRVEKVDYIFAKFTRRKVVSSIEIQTVYEKEYYYKFFNKYIHNYFCISEYLNELNLKNWGKKVPVLYLGVPILNEKKAHSCVKRVAFVGSVTERKRPHIFLEIAEEFPNLEFEIIGDGDLLNAIKTTARSKNINNVIFTGRIENHAVLEELSKCDVLLMTSSKEGLPKVILEAASCGVVSIYINEHYNVDYIENGVNGFGVNNPTNMKNTLKLLINDKKLYSRMSQKVIELYRKYSWANLIRDYEDFFKM